MRAPCFLALSTAAWSFACVTSPPADKDGGTAGDIVDADNDGLDADPGVDPDAPMPDSSHEAGGDDAGEAPIRDVVPFDPDSPDPCGGPSICAESRDQWWEYCTDPISEEHCGTSHLVNFVPPPSHYCLTWWPAAGEDSAFFIKLDWGESVSFSCVGHCIPGRSSYLFAIDGATGVAFDGIRWDEVVPGLSADCLSGMGDPLPWPYEPDPSPGTVVETTY